MDIEGGFANIIVPILVTVAGNWLIAKVRVQKHKSEIALFEAQARKENAEAAEILLEPLKRRIRVLENRIEAFEANTAALELETKRLQSRLKVQVDLVESLEIENADLRLRIDSAQS